MSTLEREQRRTLVQSALFSVLIVLCTGFMAVYVMADKDIQEALRLASVALEVERVYALEADYDQMFEAAMGSMMDKLDRYSGYIEPRRWDRFNEELEGSYSGLGITVIRHDDGLMVISVREDGPAAAAGMLNGDIIVMADSTLMAGLGVEESTSHLRGPVDSEVEVTAVRPVDEDTLVFNVTRKKINFQHVPFAGFTADSVLYIRLLDFDAQASDDVQEAIDSLLTPNQQSARGVILDLRSNPGGLLSEARRVADLFLDGDQLIVGTKGSSRWNEIEYLSSGEDLTGGLPMAILVDRGSASASEVVAGALGQLDRAVLVGDTTFGKGLVQGFTRYGDGSALRLTISRYYVEGNLFLNEFDSMLNDVGTGLPPDYHSDFVERKRFPRALEYSLLLNRFANLHQEEITGLTDQFGLDDSWVNRFREFAADEGFEYESNLVRTAEELSDVVRLKSSLPETSQAMSRLLNRAREAESDYFTVYGDYIKMRLTQIALERRFGSYEAYKKAVLTYRRDIRLASDLLIQPPVLPVSPQ